MKEQIAKIDKAASYIMDIIKDTPKIAIILGSGLGPLAQIIEDQTAVDYADIPGFPRSTVQGHEGRLISGRLGNKKILAMKGRFHYYEGYDMDKVIMPVRIFKKMGINELIVTNAAGGVNLLFKPGDIMIITDHIGFNCPSPLRGENINDFGERFPDMSSCYDKQLIKTAKTCADSLGMDIKKGVYSYSKGPMFETPAEIRALRLLGADAVGMSTVPEVITANHMKMRVLGISCITNMAAGILDQPLTHEEVMETAKTVEDSFCAYMKEIITRW